jgi:hypothetical protein
MILSRLLILVALGGASLATGRDLTLRDDTGRPIAHADVRALETAGPLPTLGEPAVELGPGVFRVDERAREVLVRAEGITPRVVRLDVPPAVVNRCTGRQIDAMSTTGTAILRPDAVAASPAVWERLDGLWPGTPNRLNTQPPACSEDILVVRAPGFAPSVCAERTCVLERGNNATGQVLSASGSPLAGAVVRALIHVPGSDQTIVATSTSTDDRGFFTLKGVPSAFRLRVDATGQAGSLEDVGVTSRSITVRLPEACVISGRVLDATRTAIPDVRVSAEGFHASRPGQVVKRSLITGLDGRFEFRLPAAFDRLRLTAASKRKQFDSHVILERLGPKRDFGDWLLGATLSRTGTVRDDLARPLKGVAVDRVRSRERLTETGPDGTFEVAMLPGQALRLEFSAPGHSTETVVLSSEAAAPASVTMRRLATVRVPVLLPGGAPCMSADLEWKSNTAEGAMEILRSRRIGEDLAFDVTPGVGSAFLSVPAFERMELGALTLKPGQGVRLSRVSLQVGASIRGRLVADESGLPLAGVLVTAQSIREDDIRDASLNAPPLPAMRSRSDGEFRVSGLVPGRTRLFIEAPGRAIRRIDVEASDSGTDLADLPIEVGEPLEVTVQRPDGTPASGVDVVLRPGGFDGYLKESTFSTDEDGRLIIPKISKGKFGLRATLASHYCRKLISIRPGTRQISWTLRTVQISGTLTGPDGSTLGNVPIFLWYEGAGVIAISDDRSAPDGIPFAPHVVGDKPIAPPVVTDQLGRFLFPDASEGSAMLYGEGRGWAVQRVRVSVPEAGKIDVPYATGQETLKVRMRAEDGSPAGGAVGLFGVNGVRVAQGFTDQDGEVLFYLSDPGQIRSIRCSDGVRQRGFRAVSQAEIADSNPIDVFVARGTAELRMAVHDGDGNSVRNARVLLRCLQDASVTWGRTGDDGVFVKKGILAALYRVSVTGPGGGFGERDVALVAGGSQSSVELLPAGELRLTADGDDDFDGRSLRVEVLDDGGRDWAQTGESFGMPAHFGESDRYTLSFLPKGEYRVRVKHGTKELFTQTVRIEEGRSTDRTVTIK